LVADAGERGRFEFAMALDAGFEGEIEDAAREEGTLDGVRRFAGDEEFLDFLDEAAKVVMRAAVLEVHEGRDGLGAADDVDGDGEIFDGSGEEEGGAEEAVVVFDDEDGGGLDEGFQVAGFAGFTVGEGLIEEALGPGVRGEELPTGFAFEALDAFDTGFAAGAAFGHGLEGFEDVEAVDIESAVGYGDGVALPLAPGSVDGGLAVGYRGGRAGEHGELEFAGDFNHAVGLAEAPGEVFIVEQRDRAATLAKDVGDFEEHLKAGVEALLLVVKGVVAVFADEYDAIDGKFISAEGKGVGDGAVHGDFVFAGEGAADVLRGELFEEEGDDLGAGIGRALVLVEAFEVLADDDVAVGSEAVFGDDGGDAFGGWIGSPSRCSGC